MPGRPARKKRAEDPGKDETDRPRRAADLALAAGFGGGGGLATLAFVGSAEDLSSAAVGLGFGGGLLLGLAPWRRLRRWLDPRLARRPANGLHLGLAAGLVFVFVFTGQCELQQVAAPEALPALPEAMAAGLLGLWSAFFLCAARRPGRGASASGGHAEAEIEPGAALRPGGASLCLGAAFGVGCFLGSVVLTALHGGAPDWGDARYGGGAALGVAATFALWRWVGRRVRSSGPPGAWRPVLPGFLAGGVTVAGLVGWAWLEGPLGGSVFWIEDLVASGVHGVWNACLLGFGFGFLIPDRAPAPRP